MYSEISFPAFGITLNPSRGIDLGPLSIRWYGVIIACGLLLAVCYATKRCKQFGLKENDLLDGILWVTPFAFVCARIYYCAFSWDTYRDNPISCLYIWEGGLAIYGGVIGAVIGAAVLCKIKKIRLPAVLDLCAIGFLLGQALGRWGNFFNREAFGAETGSLLRMGLLNQWTGETIYVHPTFLYESLWNLVGFALLHVLSKRRKYDGQTALQYAAWYGAGRAIIEGLRSDSLYIPHTGIRVSQLLSVLLCAAALIALLVLSLRTPKQRALYALRADVQEAPATPAPLEPEAAGEDVAPEAQAEPIAAEAACSTTQEKKSSLWERFSNWLHT